MNASTDKSSYLLPNARVCASHWVKCPACWLVRDGWCVCAVAPACCLLSAILTVNLRAHRSQFCYSLETAEFVHGRVTRQHLSSPTLETCRPQSSWRTTARKADFCCKVHIKTTPNHIYFEISEITDLENIFNLLIFCSYDAHMLSIQNHYCAPEAFQSYKKHKCLASQQRWFLPTGILRIWGPLASSEVKRWRGRVAEYWGVVLCISQWSASLPLCAYPDWLRFDDSDLLV